MEGTTLATVGAGLAPPPGFSFLCRDRLLRRSATPPAPCSDPTCTVRTVLETVIPTEGPRFWRTAAEESRQSLTRLLRRNLLHNNLPFVRVPASQNRMRLIADKPQLALHRDFRANRINVLRINRGRIELQFERHRHLTITERDFLLGDNFRRRISQRNIQQLNLDDSRGR